MKYTLAVFTVCLFVLILTGCGCEVVQYDSNDIEMVRQSCTP